MKRAIFAFGVLVCCNLNAQSPKTFATKTNSLDNFTGYKVAANARQLGTEYWENTNVLSDLMICVFQKNYEVFAPPQGEAYCAWTQSICNGDFNNDGYIDVFNSGTAFGGKKANLSLANNEVQILLVGVFESLFVINSGLCLIVLRLLSFSIRFSVSSFAGFKIDARSRISSSRK